MSIAISVVVKPSRFLLMMLGGMCVLAASMGGVIAFLLADISRTTCVLVAVLSFIAAFLGFYHTARNQKTLHIDISGLGQLRLMEVNTPRSSCQEQNRPHVTKNGDVVRLLKDSTIWSNLLLLRLQADGGEIAVVPILPDCVSRESFRALLVVCRWLVARNSLAEHKNL